MVVVTFAKEGNSVSGTRTYHAYTMAEALAAVKYDLGAEAIILSTRTFKRGGLLGLGRRTVVEVTAANTRDANAALSAPPAPNAPATPKSGNAAASKAYATNKPAAQNTKGAIAARGAAVQALATEADRQRTKRMAMALQEQQQRRAAAAPANGAAAKAPVIANNPSAPPVRAPSLSSPVAASVPSGVAPSGGIPLAPVLSHAAAPSRSQQPVAQGGGGAGNGNSLLVTVPATPMSVAAKRFILRSADAPPRSGIEQAAAMGGMSEYANESAVAVAAPPVRSEPSTPAGIVSIGAPAPVQPGYAPPARHASHARAANGEMSPQVQQELAAIKSMVGQVLQRQTAVAKTHTPSMPPKLFDMYLRLVGLDVPDELADLIVNDMREQLGQIELENEAALFAAAVEHLADHIPVSPTPLNMTSPNGRPLTIALVGPTGVGKTTTLAKLAASFKLKAGRKVGLITADTYRIAAVDQLRTYANIIGLPLQVALTPADMRQAVASMSDCEVILVDTAGRSQKDAMRIAELRQFIEAAHPHEVHMVLSATAGEKVLISEAEAFGRVGVNKLILTKMDEAASLGSLMNLLRIVGKPVSFITTGQEVPDHLEPAKSQRLAELVLGGQLHESRVHQ